jgi:hypothetical protein
MAAVPTKRCCRSASTAESSHGSGCWRSCARQWRAASGLKRPGSLHHLAGHHPDLLECNPVTIRAAVHRFEKGRLDALPDAPRPGRPARILNPEDRAELVDLLDRSAAARVTWTALPCVTGSATSGAWKSPRPRRPAEVAQPAGIRLAQGA